MRRINPEVDIILDILKAVKNSQPGSEFVNSLLHQYQERGGLSKKQLQGLYGKASRIATIPAAKLATLEAIILKKPTKERSQLPDIKPELERDEKVGHMIKEILAKQPAHKRVLFLQSRFEKNDVLTPQEITELQKFFKLFYPHQ